jgi:hypothetical protein
MKFNLKFNRYLKAQPLPAGASIMRRIEYALEWIMSWLVIHIDGYPVLSGLATGVVLTLLFGSIGLLITALSGHLR